MKVTKPNRGITLIALVITIIVMLILVAVTINMAVNGGLFGYAGNATRDTKTAKDEEQDWANVGSNLTTEQLIAKYTKTNPDLAKLKKYFEGKLLYEETKDENRRDFINNEIITDASESVIWEVLSGDKLYITYNDNLYKLSLIFYDENGNGISYMTLRGDARITKVEEMSFLESIVFSGWNLASETNDSQYYWYKGKFYKLIFNETDEATNAQELTLTGTYGLCTFSDGQNVFLSKDERIAVDYRTRTNEITGATEYGIGEWVLGKIDSTFVINWYDAEGNSL